MEKEFTGKSILIIVPNHFELPIRFKENLEFYGFEVFQMNHSENAKLSLIQNIKHGFSKFILKDKTLKSKYKADKIKKIQKNIINNFPDSIDYGIIIRTDLISQEVIQLIRNKVNFLCAYQWDGLDRFPTAKNNISYFDQYFVFDVRDLKYENTKPLSNFYFDDIIKDNEISQDVFFIGTYMKNRIDIIVKLSRKFKNLGLQSNINLHCSKKKYYKNLESENINFISKQFPFKENLKQIMKSKILLDFANDIHYGLSFRTFECIGYQKKLITNNSLVKKYDFYHPDNIFVIENDKLEGLEEFLEKPYHALDEKIVKKYGFNNWIKYALHIEPHQKIELHF